jgi:hypothetical protein
MAFASNPVPTTSFEVAPINVDPSMRTAFKHQAPKPRRTAIWSAAVLVLLALLPIGMLELHQELQFERVLDVAGISGGTGAGDSAAVSASAVGTAVPVIPPIAADAGAAISMPTEPVTADSPTSNTAPAPSVAQPPAPTPAPTRVAHQRTSRAPATPREVCGARTQFSLYRCMQAQCSQRRWASHAQCEHLRITDSVD